MEAAHFFSGLPSTHSVRFRRLPCRSIGLYLLLGIVCTTWRARAERPSEILDHENEGRRAVSRHVHSDLRTVVELRPTNMRLETARKINQPGKPTAKADDVYTLSKNILQHMHKDEWNEYAGRHPSVPEHERDYGAYLEKVCFCPNDGNNEICNADNTDKFAEAHPTGKLFKERALKGITGDAE